MVEENISQGFRLENKDETRNYLTEKIKNEKMIYLSLSNKNIRNKTISRFLCYLHD